MRATLVVMFAAAVGVTSEVRAQGPTLEVDAGLGYARVFDAGGISFAAALHRSLSPSSTQWQHALGGSVWYAHTGISTAPNDPEGRHILGLGIRYQVGLRARSFQPFLAVPVQLLHSNIPDRPQADLLSSSLRLHGVPDPGPLTPIQNRIGAEWGWGTGLELGFQVGLAEDLSAQTSVQGLYQNIYGPGTDNGAWNWHAGISYAFNGR